MLRRIAGFSLIELLVATAVGLVVLSGVVTLFTETTRAGTGTLRAARLHQSLLTVMSVMTRELRRAGYWSAAQRTLGGAAVNGFAPLHAAGTGCMLFSYDQDRDDPDGAPDADDQHGFRLRAGGIQFKTSDAGCGDTTCRGCTGGRWWTLTDPGELLITGLEFTLDEQPLPFNDGANALVMRSVRIRLTGALSGAPGIEHSLQATVAVRNDEIR